MRGGWLTLVVYALAVYRLTRLVTQDSLTEPIREAARRHAYTTFEKRDPFANTVTETRVQPRSGFWRLVHDFLTCAWCVSIWAAGAVVALGWSAGGWFWYIAVALAFSTVAGVISERV